GGDEPKGALQCDRRDPLLAVIAVDEEARDPPVGRSRAELRETPHARRKLGRRSELAPPDDVAVVIYQCGVGAACPHELLLELPPGEAHLLWLTTREVELHAPAA